MYCCAISEHVSAYILLDFCVGRSMWELDMGLVLIQGKARNIHLAEV
jgi:hypothetical protein